MKLTFVAILLILALSIRVNAQETESESYYAIKVAPNFSSYNNCNVGDNYKPVLKSWQVKIDDVEACNIQYGNECIINVKDINKMTIKIIATIGHFDGENKITIGSSDIIGDDKRLKIGKNYLKKSGSDYCNPFHKEGYEFRPVITIDNPIEIDATEVVGEKSIGNQAENFVTTNQNLVFHLNEFYKENDDIELKYSLNGIDSWLPVKSYNGEFTSGGQISISYSDIVGEYSSVNSDYYDNLGRRVWFLIEKRLLDGTKVQSKTVCKNFFQDHAEFKIEESSLYLSSCGNLSLVLNDVDPITIKALKNNELKISAGDLPIYNWSYNGNSISFSYYETTPKTDKEISIRAGVPISEITEEYQENVKFLHPYTQSFKVPEKPEPLRFKQSSTIYPIDEPKYHLETENNPYAILLMEKEDLYHRIPYTVRWTDNNVAKQVQIYKSKNKVSDEESRDEYFKDKDNSYFEGLAKWKMFLEAHFINYFNELIFPQKVNDCVKDNSCDNPWTDVSNYPLILVTRNGNKVKLYRFTMSNIKNKNGQRENNGISYITINNVTDDAWSYIKTRVKKYYNESSISIVIDKIEDSKTTYYTDNPYINQNYTSSSHYVFTLDDSFYSGLTIEDKGQFVYFDKAEQYVLAKKDNGYYLVNCYSLFSFELKDFSNTAKYVMSYKGDKCAYVCNGMLYCNGKKLGDAESVNTLLSVSGDYVYYKDKNGNIYKKMILNNDDKYHYRELYLRNKDNYDKLLEEYKESSFQNYLLTKHGYRIDDIKANTDYIISINDNDGCPAYETGTENTDISVNVKQPIKPSLSFVPNTNPSSVCSNDGTVTVQINNDNKGNMPLYYMVSQQQVITIEEGPVILPNIGINDIVVMDDFGILYSYPSPFKNSNTFNGITSVIPHDVTCDSQSNGKIVVNFNNNSNIEKTYVLYNNSVRGKSIKTKDNTIRFDGLDVGSNYSVRVEIEDGKGRTCELESESYSIGSKIFSYNIIKNDAYTIGGNGTIAISGENIPDNVSWTCNNQPFSNYYSQLQKPAGQYRIDARWDGCSLSKQETINEPYCKAEVEIIYDKDQKEGSRCEIKISNAGECTTTVQEITPYFVVDGNKGLNFKELNENLVHKIEYVYGEKSEQRWVLSEIKVKDVFTANNHSFYIPKPHNCPGDVAQYKINATNDKVKIIHNGHEYDDFLGGTESGSVSYVIKETSGTDERIKSTSSLLIKYSTARSYTEDIPTVEKISASVDEIVSFQCSYSDYATIEINNIAGGRNDTQLQYWLKKADGKESIGELETCNSKAAIDVVNEGEYVLYLKDVKNGCPQENIGRFAVKKPTPISVVENHLDPYCIDGRNGEIQIKASGGSNRLDEDGKSIGYIYEISDQKIDDILKSSNVTEDTYQGLASKEGYEKCGLPFGTYYIYVIDGNFCKYTKDITLKKYTNPSVLSAQTDSVSCYGLSDGVIKGIEVKTNGSLNGNAVSVTEMKYWKVGKEDAAEGEKDAELEKSDEKGWIPYSESIHDLKAGTYKILLKDNNECESGEYSIEVKEPDGIQLAVEPKYKYYGEDGTEKGKIKSYGGDDGEIKVRVDGGNYGYKYVIVEANTTQVPTSTYNSIGNLSAQKYTVIATDNKNCPSNSVDVELVAPLTPLKVEINTTAALCRSRVGSATVAVEGGWSDYKIDLVGEHETRSTVGKTVTYEGLYAGKYELHVTDDMGVTLDTVLVISSPEPISYTYDITPEVCEENTGVIKIEFEDEDPQCKLFFGGQEYDVEEREIRFENLSSNKAGGYVMTIVDKNECESELTFEVPDNKMTVSIEDRYEVNKGVMSAVVDHGAAPYMYKWEYMSGSNEMGTESSFATDKNGIYHLTVTDANGCTREKTHSLLLEGDRRFIVEEVHRETAFEKKDGLVKLRCEEDEITVERLYIYIGEEKKELKDVKKDGSSYIIDDLAGGDYSVEGILANGCKVLADFHIESYEKMDADVVILRHVSRPKYSDGVINVDVTGGIAPYTVRISTEVGDNVGDEMETAGRLQIDNLQAGIYTLSITDSTENVLTLENYEIKEPAPIKVTSTDKRANCYNEKSAEAKIMAEGGWPGYQYADAKEGVYKNSNIFTELPAGRRKFYVIDKYGVVDSIFVRLTEPDELRATVAAIDSVKCKGDSNGKILFDVTGGTPGYKTLMLKDGIAYDMRDQVGWDNLLSGHYTATFTDYNRCETPDTIEFYIPEPDSLEVALMDVVHTTCELDNGKISIRMKGGSLPYKYEWAENGEVYTKNKNIGLTLTQAEGLLQNGLYRVEIRDSHDCYAKTEDVRIAESHNPSIKQDGVQTIDALCKNSSDGTAFVDSTDIIIGIPASPFKLMWPQGQSGVMKVNTLPAGRYEVEIRDDNNCHTTSEFTIEEPDSVSNRLVGLRNALCYGYSDGRIETATIGGVGGYSYLWNTGETTNYLDSIKAGEYTVVVKDAHGCEHVASYEITEPEELKVYLGEDVLICPKGVHVFDGGEYTTYSWRKVATGEEIETGRYMATGEEGDYAIKVTNAIGCIARDTVNLSIGENALIANFLMASDAAVNDTIELIELSNMPIDSLRWVYNTDIFSDVTPYGAGRDRLDILAGETGSYYITMWAYSGGCESFEDKHIDICEALDKDADFEIGYDPIIQSVKATPNPNDGEFNLIVKLREEYDVTVTINSVNTGQQIEKLELKGADKYNHRLNIRDWGSGMYVLSVFVGDERRAVKVVSTR
ncbi:MAG: SprB repeat-containing protein [Bacteroidales bacterium]|nr:SprB repeat-containing protein [Bacteroidales bacterium]